MIKAFFSRRSVRQRRLISAAGVIGVLLLGFRLMLPSLLHDYANKALDQVGEYHGEIGQVRVHLWRGAYQLQDVKLVKREGKVPVPFFATDVLDLSISWPAIFRGALVGKITLKNPKINFVADSKSGGAQTSIDASWQDQFIKLFPLKFDQVVIENGEIWFHNFTSQPPVNLKLDHVNAIATNLTNSHHLSKTLVTTMAVKGRAMDAANFHAEIHSDVFQKPPSFTLKVGLDDLPLEKLNDFFKAYAFITAKSGTFSLYAEVNSEKGHYQGYAKPLLDHPKFFDVKTDSSNPIRFLWEGLAGIVTFLLKNQVDDRFATRIPVSGTVENPHFGLIPALGNVFRNAFIKAFVPGFEGKVHPAEIKDEKQGKNEPPVQVQVKAPPPVN